MQERRTHPRASVFVPGEAILSNGALIDCTIRNLSRGGAVLAFQYAIGLPRRFALRIKTSLMVRDVEVVWYRTETLAVRFVDEHHPAWISPPDLAAARERS